MDSDQQQQREAQHRWLQGAVLLLLNMPPSPPGLEIGVDLRAWKTAPNFHGIKMIPPGLHLIFYSAYNTESTVPGPKSGFFHYYKSGEILIKRWDPSVEDFVDVENNEEEVKRCKADILSMDAKLAPFQYDDSLKQWGSMINYITPELLQRWAPEGGRVDSVAQDVQMLEKSQEYNQWKNKTNSSQNNRDSNTVTSSDFPAPSVSNKLGFVPIDLKKTYPIGATAAEITKHSLDKSYFLNSIFTDYYPQDKNGLLGELQFAFLSFLLVENFDGLEQWKKIIIVLCSCEDVIMEHTTFFIDFIGVLRNQMEHLPQDFFRDLLLEDNFLKVMLKKLYKNVEELREKHPDSKPISRLKFQLDQFHDFLNKRFELKFISEDPVAVGEYVEEDEDIPEDERPVIVEL